MVVGSCYFHLLVFGMSKNDGQKPQHLLLGGVAAAAAGSVSGGRTNNNGFIPSFRTLSGYLKIVSSGASTVARSAASSFASSILDKGDAADCDRVCMSEF